MKVHLWFSLLSWVSYVFSAVTVTNTNPLTFTLIANSGGDFLGSNTVLSGSQNSSVTAVKSSNAIAPKQISPTVYRVDISLDSPFTGLDFSGGNSQNFFGVWEYPWFGSISNSNVSFQTKGVGNSEGVNWSNLRAAFFMSSAGYGVYVDTEAIGTFDFATPGSVRAVFNASSFTYYIIIPEDRYDFKSILQDYTGFSTRMEMPPDSGYGPTFWSDDFEQDFHGYVTNAQQNYYDVIDHLYYNQIHASSMFADRPYGTGNYSFGNFDFDPTFYPTPQQFIANLSTWGFDFQVWVANRAFLDNELYNASIANGWLFQGIDPELFLGPALNLSIPEAYDYFKQKLSYFTSVGVKGYKIDRGEEGEMPLSEQNIQDVLFRKLCYESMAEKWGPSTNFYNFARSAYDTARSLTYAWNGDSMSNFTGLQYSIASGIRAGILGFSQWGSDTGGYVRSAAPIASMPSEELWARWMHFSTYSPVFEIMIGTNHTPWYPPYTSELVDILKIAANTHHDLVPYIRSYTYQAHLSGPPLIRALFLEAPYDSLSYSIADEYFFGEYMLVAPITEAGGSRTVHFPSLSLSSPSSSSSSSASSSSSPSSTIGTQKYLSYNDKSTTYPSGSNTTLSSIHLSSIPVFVREGAIIPRGDIVQANNKWTSDWKPCLTIELFPSFSVGRSQFAYWNGNRSVEIVMVATRDGGKVVVEYDGDLGVGGNGVFVLYGQGAVMNRTLGRQELGGGRVEWDGVVSLFD